MTTWLDSIRMELETVDESDIIPPSNDPDIDNSEEVVARLENMEIRKLYALARKYAKTSSEAVVESQYAAPEDQKILRGRAAQLNLQARALLDIFWVEARAEYNCADEEHVGLRADWAIVRIPVTNDSKLNLLRKMLEGEGW